MGKLIREEEVCDYPPDTQVKIWMKQRARWTLNDIIVISDIKSKISPENIKLIERLERRLMSKEMTLREAVKKDGTDYESVPDIKDEDL